jgi:hypothetical protein
MLLPCLKELALGSLEHFHSFLVTDYLEQFLDGIAAVALVHERDHRTGNTVAVAAGPGVGETRWRFTCLESLACGSAVRPLQLSRHINGQSFNEPPAVVHVRKVRSRVLLTVIDVNQFVGDQVAHVFCIGWIVLGRLGLPHARRQNRQPIRDSGRHHPGRGVRELPALAEVLIECSSIRKHLDFERLRERLAEEPFHLLLTLLKVRL